MSKNILQGLIDTGAKLTPMMEQFHSIKKNYEDHILLFRMGDFYEVFFEDAQNTSKRLNITLTNRGKIAGTPIPMAGIPHHAASAYIDRLTSQGIKVAICEQVEDPSEAKGIVKRAVTQVVSPGLPYDLDKTEARDSRYIMSATKTDTQYSLIAIDFTTGEFIGQTFNDKDSFIDRIRIFNPKEFLTFMNQWEELPEIESLCEHHGILRTHLGEEFFNPKHSALYIEKMIPGYKRDKIIKSEQELLRPIGALAYYICSTQQLEEFFHIRPFKILNQGSFLKVTLPTLIGLEILPKSRDQYKDSLLGFLDRTQTSMGSRRLRKMMTGPLTEKSEILKRQDCIQSLVDRSDLLETLKDTLSEVRDLERILAKVSSLKANGGDLLNLEKSITIYQNLKRQIEPLLKGLTTLPTTKEIKKLIELSELIGTTINDEMAASLEKGNLIRSGANKKRDRLAKLASNASSELSRLEEEYRQKTGIQKLRIKFNNVAGYFIEVSKSHTDKVPKSFERRQTLVNCERYTTKELTIFEKEMVSAKDKLSKLEREIFKEVIQEVGAMAPLVQKMAECFSLIDVFSILAWITLQEDFRRPQISEEKGILLEGAWHPLIKETLKNEFIPHNLTLNEESFFGVITGPNMAGKTTVMREVAIIQILTQLGCFVPAKSAKVSLCDFLFSRLGASDDILKGQSTFMVEMTETAEIIRHATQKSLIILDEVGRGTSTYDGLSIAWALVEHLVANIKAVGLFATHYHELIELADQLPGAKNLTVETRNHKGNVQFLYRLIEQGASQSFGIYVAKLAGLPQSLLKRSQQILSKMEKESQKNKNSSDFSFNEIQLNFFEEDKPSKQIPDHLLKLEEDIRSLDISKLTPLQALNQLNGIQQELLQ